MDAVLEPVAVISCDAIEKLKEQLAIHVLENRSFAFLIAALAADEIEPNKRTP